MLTYVGIRLGRAQDTRKAKILMQCSMDLLPSVAAQWSLQLLAELGQTAFCRRSAGTIEWKLQDCTFHRLDSTGWSKI